MKILVINGPNINMLGIREPEVYGKENYETLCSMIEEYSSNKGIEVEIYQSNHEGCLVDKIQEAFGKADGIVINPGATIGRNFTISQGCLIGSAQGKKNGIPTIGNNVCMNANSIIIGGVNIGNNVLIAPGAFINFDVPDNSIVIGNPGKIIVKESSPTEKYIVYSV